MFLQIVPGKTSHLLQYWKFGKFAQRDLTPLDVLVSNYIITSCFMNKNTHAVLTCETVQFCEDRLDRVIVFKREDNIRINKIFGSTHSAAPFEVPAFHTETTEAV